MIYDEGVPSDAETVHIAHNDPASVLDAVDACRAIVDAVERSANWRPHPGRPCTNDPRYGGDPYQPCELDLDAYRHRPPLVDPHVLRLAALRYVRRSGYREEWRP